jgi:surface antigen
MASVGLTACTTISPSGNTVETTQSETAKTKNAQEAAATPAAPADQGTLHEVNLDKTSVNAELIGGSIEKSMDQDDKTKLSRALDKAPGKTTTWENGLTGITYTVTPTKKIVIRDKPFCREYHTTATKGGNMKEITGTACVASDGNWHTISRS